MQAIQYRKSRIWEIKEDKYRLCQESGLCNMLDARYSEKRFTQIYKALYGNAMLGHQYGRRKLTETYIMYVFEFSY